MTRLHGPSRCSTQSPVGIPTRSPVRGWQPELLTEAELCGVLRLDGGRTPGAQRKALDRAWRQAQDIRGDRKLAPLTRIRIGSQRYYDAATVSALLETLSFEF